jgi:hypothetical protein
MGAGDDLVPGTSQPMKRPGLTVDEVERRLRKHDGNMAAVARTYGVNRSTVKRFVDAHPSLLAVCADCREALKDTAEKSLQAAVKKGEAWAVCFFLKCQAKDRGYVERQEVDHGGDVGLRVKRVVVDAAGDAAGGSGSNGRAAPGAGGVLSE